MIREHRISPDEWERWIGETDGAQLIVAGPGTGKTEFLVRRVAHIVASGIARRDQVAIFSFSRRSAAELRSRISDGLKVSGVPIESSTFHSFALRLIEAADGRRPVPLTTPEQVAVVAALLSEETPDDWPIIYRGILTSRGFAAEIADFLMRCSERLLSPGHLREMVEQRADWRGIPELFQRYRDRLREMDRIDYGTLLVNAVDLLETPAGLALADAYRYVLVDEYQDTSPAQAAIARLLAGRHGNLTAAGDPYQSVYSFRGAEVRNIARFTDEHETCLRLVLDRSFRVPAEILESALRVVSSGELPGASGPVLPAGHHGRVEAYLFDQETAEAEWIGQEIEHSIHAEGINPADIAILVRSKREMLNEISRALTRRRLAHDPPRRRLVDHPAVRFINDLVTVAEREGSADPSGSAEADRAMRRVLLGPMFALTLGKERDLTRKRRRTESTWSGVLRAGWEEADEIADLIEATDWWREIAATDGFWYLWEKVSAFRSLVDDPAMGSWRLALSSFAQVLSRQADRDSSLNLSAYFALTEDEEFEAEPLISPTPGGGQITLTTLHQAKGLEFDFVIIANAVEGVFPDLRRSRRMLRPELLSPERTSDPGAQHIFQVQEEMRLAYTAMTRARRRVVWTATDAGVDQGEHRPSRFLLAASGAAATSELASPIEPSRAPVTVPEFEVALRRTVLDPTAPTVSRLAAVQVLAAEADSRWETERFAGVAATGPDTPILAGKIRLSPSQADAYATCPRKYALERRLHLVGADSPYATFGSLVHKALELAESSVIGTGAVHADLAVAMQSIDVVWQDADFGTPQLTAAWKKQAIEGVTKLYEKWPGTGIPVALETRVETEIEGVTWIGVIDRLEVGEDGLHVIDYKSGKTVPSNAEAATSIQLGFYTAAVADAKDEPVAVAEMWFPRSSAISVTVRKLKLDNMTDIRTTMAGITRSIVAEDWSPRINAKCGKCDFRLSCPAWPEGLGAYVP